MTPTVLKNAVVSQKPLNSNLIGKFDRNISVSNIRGSNRCN